MIPRVLLAAALLAAVLGFSYLSRRVSPAQEGGGGPAAGCPVDPRREGSLGVRIAAAFPEPAMDRSASTQRLQEMSRASGREEEGVRGLTDAEPGLRTSYSLVAEQRPDRSGYCVWLSSLSLAFSYERLTVYVTDEYPEGSCAYEQTLRHELDHVAVHRRLHAEYASRFHAALRAGGVLPTAARPLAVRSRAEGEEIVARKLDGITAPVLAEFRKAAQTEEDQLDSPQEYARIREACPQW